MEPLFDDEVLIGRDTTAARAYRLHLRMAVVATIFFVVPAVVFGADGVSILAAGGDTRGGIVPYLGFVATVVVGTIVLWPLWKQAGASRWTMLHPVPDLELAPEAHLTITEQIRPPRRW